MRIPPLLQPPKPIQIILNVYPVLLCTLLLLWMPEGYRALGEHKFMLYRILTLAALGLCVVFMLADRSEEREQKPSLFDALLLACALAQILCFVLSGDRALSLFGIDGWRDGLFTELTFLLLAYFYAHSFRPAKHLRLLLLIGPAVVFLLTAGQCVLFPDTHRLYYSTIGNNNWYAGFLSVSLPAGVALLLAKQKRSKAERALLVLYLMLALVSCVLVKSMSVILFLVPLAFLAVLFRFSVSGNEALAANARRLFTLAVYAIVPVCVLTLLLQLVYPFSDLFGSGRGVIWNAAQQLLQTFSVRQWLFGTGQDLFYQATCADAAIHAQLESVFPGFRVTNAHAELLHMLVTQGLAGVCTYLALLFYTLKRALKELYGENRTVALCCILVIASYLATGTVTFRHVLSAPFVYMLAGVCLGLQSKNSTTYSSR